MQLCDLEPVVVYSQPMSALIGREHDLTTLVQVVAETRLATLVGPGGCGKTRLAGEAARQLATRFADGVIWVELAGLADGTWLAQTVANALPGGPYRGAPLDALRAVLGQRAVLLILDTCEHVRAACCLLVEQLLEACPGLHVLATSREALGLPGETRVPLNPLLIPDPGARWDELQANAAIRLFAVRAAEVQPGFTLNPDNIRVVATICRRLDGLPLALELAAARVRVLSVHQIADRLEDALNWLTRQHPSGHATHPSLRAALAWSDQLLTDAQRALFYALSVFAGTFTVEMAEAVVGEALKPDVLDGLEDLIGLSLVVADGPSGSENRFRLLDTVRDYAREALQTQADHPRAHHGWLLAAARLGESALVELKGARQGEWLDRLALDLDNLRAALRWSLESGALEPGLRLASGLEQFWWVRGGLAEGLTWLEALLDQAEVLAAPVDARVQAAAQLAAGVVAYRVGDLPRAQQRLTQSLTLRRLQGDEVGAARVINNLGNVALDSGDYALAEAHYRDSLAIRRRHADVPGTASVLNNLADTQFKRARLSDAQKTYEESLDLYWQIGDLWSIASCLNSLGEVARRLGQFDQARVLLAESHSLCREIGDERGEAFNLNYQANLALSLGRWAEAAGLIHTSLSLLTRGNHLTYLPAGVETAAWLAARQDSARRALRLYAYAAGLRQSLGMPTAPSDMSLHQPVQDALQAHFGPEALAVMAGVGRALTPAQVLAEVETLCQPAEPAQAATGVTPSVRVVTLGRAQVWVDGRELTDSDWTYVKAKELFYYLLANPGVIKSRLGLDLWPDASPAQLRSAFHRTMHHVRKALGHPDWIGFAQGAYTLALPDTAWVDRQVFAGGIERAALAVKAGRSSDAIADLVEALGVYRGDYLDLAGLGDWAMIEREALRRRAFEAHLQLSQLLFEAERYTEAADAYRELIAFDPYIEVGHRGLMRSLAQLGEVAQAVRHYHTLHRLLADDLATEPAPETQALFDQLRKGASTRS